jgi:DNA recombination protein RmuC
MESVLIGILIGLGLAAVVVVVLRRSRFARPSAPEPEMLKAQFAELSRTALRTMGEDFLRLAKEELKFERQQGLSDLDAKRQAVDNTIKGLQEKLTAYEQLMSDFEKDRDEKYGQLKGELNRLTKGTDRLQDTTANLAAVLGNSRVRGQWGQRIADDILRHCGLQEGMQYHREQSLAAGRPDYTFVLPDHHQLFMDVKFPLENYLKLTASPQEEQPRHREAFLRDVRGHLREMERRDYVTQAEQSLDYILIFIPNEQVYSLVNEWMPELLDECMKKKIILCGPSTLYAVLRVIAQAWDNFRFSMAIRDIVKAISGFLQDYDLFRRRFSELGELVHKLDTKYQEIAVTSTQRLEARIRRIEEYRKGQHIPSELPGPERNPAEQPVISVGEPT